MKISRLHADIANIRKDFLHKVSHFLSNHFNEIALEDLSVSNMVKNRHLSKAISDLGWYEFKRQLTYKLERNGGQLHLCDRWFASSKICPEVSGLQQQERKIKFISKDL